MRRFTFYILVAVITFGIGSFFAYKKFAEHLKTPVIQIKEVSEVKTDTVQAERDKKQIIEENCWYYNDDLNFSPIIESWLSGKKLKNEPYCANSAKKLSNYKMPDTGIVSVWDIVMPTLIDLNGDGKKELALRSGCSGSGNCEAEIFEKTKKSYRKIFKSVVGVKSFETKPSKHKGYHDIWTKYHSSGDSGFIVSYQFNGEIYEPSNCYDYHYEQNYGEPIETRAKPKLILESVSCSKNF